MESKRLTILNNSLEKKKMKYDQKLKVHFDDVKSANGQPLNDKGQRGQSVLNRWERQENALRTCILEIEKTEKAIKKEERKIESVEYCNEAIPSYILQMVNDGQLIQWRRFPNRFFVPGVENARICWDFEKEILFHRYVDQIQDDESYKKFATIYNDLRKNVS